MVPPNLNSSQLSRAGHLQDSQGSAQLGLGVSIAQHPGSFLFSNAVYSFMQHQGDHSSETAGAMHAESSTDAPPGSQVHMVPFQLVDLVKPAPFGTVASTAALATAAHAAVVAAATDVAPAGLLATVAAGKATSRKTISTIMQVC